ncbi:MAG: hypothetical protein KAX19_09900, partial [Candidatus Brocadiae bacterium]|nr:hypothetical protein [Candidatus Brocadiia bacterium]
MSKHIAVMLLAAASLSVLTAPTGAETVRLKNGNVITGEVLADKAEFVAVDLGYTILEIPRDQVASIEQETAESPE